MKTITCVRCGKIAPRGRGNKIYCSEHCSSIAYRERHPIVRDGKKQMKKKTCIACGEQFVPRASGSKWCSEECIPNDSGHRYYGDGRRRKRLEVRFGDELSLTIERLKSAWVSAGRSLPASRS